MRSYLAVGVVVAVLVGLLAGGGCVSKAEHDEALALCRRANDRLQEALGEVRTEREAKDQLAERLDEANQARKAKQREIALLESQNGDLQKNLDDLKARYDRLRELEAPLRPTALPAAVDAALQGFARSNPELVEYLPKYGMVKFKADLTFEKGSDDVSSTATEALTALVEILNSEAAAAFHVYVAGHTDDIPIQKRETLRRHPTNWYLSVHRAVEVQKVLVKAGLEPKRIGAMGFGEYHPVEPNKPNKKGNPKNRRVEIWIIPPERLLTVSGEAGEEP